MGHIRKKKAARRAIRLSMTKKFKRRGSALPNISLLNCEAGA